MFANPTFPNLADFVVFCLAQGVPTADLPSPYTYAQWALSYSENVTITSDGSMPAIMYVMAVYNLGLHQLIKTSPDQTGQTFFADSRKAYKMLSFTTGPVASSGDESTNQSLVVPEWMKTMSLQANDCLKTPWGISYLEYAQSYGSNIVGIS